MQQFFAFWSSTIYGVWSTEWWYVDMLKQYLNSQMFNNEWTGEKYELFNFWFSWATISDVKSIYTWVLKQYYREWHKTCILNVWANNMRAIDAPTNYVSTPEAFENEFRDFIKVIRNDFDEVIFVRFWYVVESLTQPKKSPLRPNSVWSFWYNERCEQFTQIQKSICLENDVIFIDTDKTPEQRNNDFNYLDWLHINAAWNKYFFEKILWVLKDRWIL